MALAFAVNILVVEVVQKAPSEELPAGAHVQEAQYSGELVLDNSI